MAGRKKKNPILNELNGNPGKRKIKTVTKIKSIPGGKKDAPPEKKDGFILPIPQNLSTKIKKRAKVIAEYLHKQKVSQKIDIGAFERYCMNLEYIERSIKTIDEFGIVIEDRNGMKKNPAIAIQKENGIAAAIFESKYLGEPLSRDLFSSDTGSDLSNYLNRKSGA